MRDLLGRQIKEPEADDVSARLDRELVERQAEFIRSPG